MWFGPFVFAMTDFSVAVGFFICFLVVVMCFIALVCFLLESFTARWPCPTLPLNYINELLCKHNVYIGCVQSGMACGVV